MRIMLIGILCFLSSVLIAQPLPVTMHMIIGSKNVKGQIYLEKLNDRGFGEKIDSTLISGAEFVFDTKISEPGIYQLNIANEQLIGLLLDGGEELYIQADGETTDEKAATVNITGSKNMEVFNNLQLGHFEFQNKVKAIDDKFKASSNDAARAKLREEYLDLLNNYNEEILPQVKSLGTSSAGILATNNFLNKEAKGEYFVELADRLVEEGNHSSLALIFVQSVNQDKMGMPGVLAPDFELKDLEGNTYKLSDFRGKYVVLDFWATWCGPCIMSFPGMKKAMDMYKDRDDVAFVFVNTFERVALDKKEDHVKNFIEKRNFDYLNPWMDYNNQTAFLYGVNAIPAKFFIDKEGKFMYKSKGFAGSDEAVVQEIIQWFGK